MKKDVENEVAVKIFFIAVVRIMTSHLILFNTKDRVIQPIRQKLQQIVRNVQLTPLVLLVRRDGFVKVLAPPVDHVMSCVVKQSSVQFQVHSDNPGL